MKEETSQPAEEKHSFSVSGFCLWVAVALAVYILSIGPVVMLLDRGIIKRNDKLLRALVTFYSPLIWAHEKTPLRKPLGMYLHLWSKRFDAKGDEN